MSRIAISTSDGSFELAYDLDRPSSATDICVLYAHGFASKRRGEKADFFARRFIDAGLAFCRFDFRGHGDSDGRLFDLTLSRNLEDLGAMHRHVLDQGFRRVILMGSSMGGGCAAWFARRHPEAVELAIHIAPGIEMEVGLARLLGADRMAAWQRDGEVLFEHELGEYPLGWGLIEDLRTFDADQLAVGYRTPTLIFQGVRDTSVAYGAVVDFATACDAAVDTVLMADGDHRLTDRMPYLWDLIRAFLGRHGLLDG